MSVRRKHYTEEFKLEAVRLVKESGGTQEEIAGDLGIGKSTLDKWLRHYREGLTQAPIPLLPEVLLALKPEQDAAAQQTAMQKAYRDCLVPATQSHRAADVYLSWLYGKTQPIDAHWREVAVDLVRPIPLPKQGRP